MNFLRNEIAHNEYKGAIVGWLREFELSRIEPAVKLGWRRAPTEGSLERFIRYRRD
jgi:hypothetical protein